MGKRTHHPPGTFSWVDVATTDTAAAKSFYRNLFGWEMEDTDGGSGAVYTVCRVGGDRVCGLFETDAPPSWTSYVTVADADEAAARATELGGAVIDGASDAEGAGRRAVLTDPPGAAFAVWQPLAQIGAERVNDVGCLCMDELATTDMDAARSFYEGLFGWRTELADAGPPALVLAYNGETLNASISEAEAGEGPHWRPYFTVESVDGAVERAREFGGTVVLEPIDNVDGRIAVVRDAQGVVFALYAGEVDP